MEPSETFLVQCHLQSGIGFYHHIIMKLQSNYRLDLRGIVDFPLFVTDRGLKKGKYYYFFCFLCRFELCKKFNYFSTYRQSMVDK